MEMIRSDGTVNYAKLLRMSFVILKLKDAHFLALAFGLCRK
jgi:hypothetical protein